MRLWKIPACGALIAVMMQGCVTSHFPLFDDKTLVVDRSLTGHYSLPALPNQQPAEYRVYLKQNEYLLVHDGKLEYLGTLHKWHENTYIAQLRPPAGRTDPKKPSPSEYGYLLVKKTPTGADLNLIQCQTTEICQAGTLDDLYKLAENAEEHPQDKQLATATKTAELGQ
jgi:hypothetical protein